jgi:hypothetical protein
MQAPRSGARRIVYCFAAAPPQPPPLPPPLAAPRSPHLTWPLPLREREWQSGHLRSGGRGCQRVRAAAHAAAATAAALLTSLPMSGLRAPCTPARPAGPAARARGPLRTT